MNIEQHYSELQAIAARHRKITGDWLKDANGVIGEFITIQHLNLKPAPFNQKDYDALDNNKLKYQIKTSAIEKRAHRRGSFSHIKTSQDWDFLILCTLAETYQPITIHGIHKDEYILIPDKSVRKSNFLSGQAVQKYCHLIYQNANLARLYGIQVNPISVLQ